MRLKSYRHQLSRRGVSTVLVYILILLITVFSGLIVQFMASSLINDFIQRTLGLRLTLHGLSLYYTTLYSTPSGSIDFESTFPSQCNSSCIDCSYYYQPFNPLPITYCDCNNYVRHPDVNPSEGTCNPITQTISDCFKVVETNGVFEAVQCVAGDANCVTASGLHRPCIINGPACNINVACSTINNPCVKVDQGSPVIVNPPDASCTTIPNGVNDCFKVVGAQVSPCAVGDANCVTASSNEHCTVTVSGCTVDPVCPTLPIPAPPASPPCIGLEQGEGIVEEPNLLNVGANARGLVCGDYLVESIEPVMLFSGDYPVSAGFKFGLHIYPLSPYFYSFRDEIVGDQFEIDFFDSEITVFTEMPLNLNDYAAVRRLLTTATVGQFSKLIRWSEQTNELSIYKTSYGSYESTIKDVDRIQGLLGVIEAVMKHVSNGTVVDLNGDGVLDPDRYCEVIYELGTPIACTGVDDPLTGCAAGKFYCDGGVVLGACDNQDVPSGDCDPLINDVPIPGCTPGAFYCDQRPVVDSITDCEPIRGVLCPKNNAPTLSYVYDLIIRPGTKIVREGSKLCEYECYEQHSLESSCPSNRWHQTFCFDFREVSSIECPTCFADDVEFITSITCPGGECIGSSNPDYDQFVYYNVYSGEVAYATNESFNLTFGEEVRWLGDRDCNLSLSCDHDRFSITVTDGYNPDDWSCSDEIYPNVCRFIESLPGLNINLEMLRIKRFLACDAAGVYDFSLDQNNLIELSDVPSITFWKSLISSNTAFTERYLITPYDTTIYGTCLGAPTPCTGVDVPLTGCAAGKFYCDGGVGLGACTPDELALGYRTGTCSAQTQIPGCTIGASYCDRRPVVDSMAECGSFHVYLESLNQSDIFTKWGQTSLAGLRDQAFTLTLTNPVSNHRKLSIVLGASP